MIDFNDIDYEEFDEDSWEFLRNKKYWKDKNGNKKLIKNMDDNHLFNSINFLRRRGMEKVDDRYECLLKEKEYRKKYKIKK